ncbi:MAG: hypothetical protein NTU62_09775 [Spirochaetes bacterium]|nr:hypothetical protein [Spirochaetota bacterium]
MTARRFAGHLLALALLMAASLLPAANLVVPSLEIITRGFMNAGTFELASNGEFDLVVEGGYKFLGRIALSYIDSSLEDDDNADRLAFDGANITVRDVFKLPLSLTWFVGSYDVLASGSEFPVSFGTAEIATAYRGLMYFPDPSCVQYDGIHQVKGTGIRLSSMLVPDKLQLSAYLYQDSWFLDGSLDFEPGHWSADLRVLANLASIKLEGFLGVSAVPASVAGWYRAGVLFHAASKSIEVLAELGLPKWDPVADSPFSINLFSMLVEPRLHLGLFNVAATFFWHPAYYHQVETFELGTFDVNLNLFFGDLSKTLTLGGLEGNLVFDSTSGTFSFKLAPYISFTTPGAVWKIKVNTKLWPFDTSDLLEGFVGIRASF